MRVAEHEDGRNLHWTPLHVAEYPLGSRPAEQNRTEQSRTEQISADQNSVEQKLSMYISTDTCLDIKYACSEC